MIRLVIAEDHAIVRAGLKQMFAMVSDFEVIGEAVNGSEVLECLHQSEFDLLLLDINIPGISGADLIARAKGQRPSLPILVLSMHNESQVAARMLKAGADGYISKDSEPDLLVEAIRKVAGGGRYILPELAEQMVFDTATPGDHLPHTLLSNRELDVFRLLVTGRGVNDIAAQLCISNKTVSTHKTRLMEKMNVTALADLVRYALQHDL